MKPNTSHSSFAIVATALAIAALLIAPAASATVPDFLTQAPEDNLSGSAAGAMNLPIGIAADPNLPGHVYVADNVNHRVDEYTPWGEFVRAWGWGVKDGASEFQVCTTATGCQKGLSGDGKGQLRFPEAITIDAESNLYVIEGENRRVQKFDSEGNFILTFGYKVNATKEGGSEAEANLCTAASGDVCQAGQTGTGPGRIGAGASAYYNRLTTGPTTKRVFVGEGEAIQVFEPNGGFKETIAMPAGKAVQALAADAEGFLYVAFAGETEVHKLKPNGPSAEFIGPPFSGVQPSEFLFGLAVSPAKHFFVVSLGGGGEPPHVLEFDPTGKCLNCGAEGEEGKAGFDRSPESQIRAIATGSACGPTDIYTTHFSGPLSLSFFNIWGEPPDPDLCPPPIKPPEITAQYALGVETTTAKLQGEINPKFWDDTRYYLEYGTTPCFEGGCATKPLPPGSLLTSKTTNTSLKTAAFFLEELEPGTTYHYRFVAESSGGGPVLGLSGKSGSEAEGVFRTFALPGEPPSCPANEAFRAGASAPLPDCRAYELVSPLDKEGGEIIVGGEFTTERPATLNQSSLNGNRVSYGSLRSFGDAPSAPYTTQYVAARGKAGWASHPISPPRGRLILAAAGPGIDTELKALSPDLCSAWSRSVAEPPLAPKATPGYANLYRRTDEECGGPAWEALTAVKPPNVDPFFSGALELQGLSGSGEEAIYVLGDSLTGTEAPPQPAQCVSEGKGCQLRLYYQEPGEGTPAYVCVLPNGTPIGPCSGGMIVVSNAPFRGSTYQGAISEDGSRVYWTASVSQGQIFMRENPTAPESSGKDGEGNCIREAGQACTVAVSKEAEALSGTSVSQFWAAAGDGSRAIFTTSKVGVSDLYEYDLATEEVQLIAHEVLGLVGVSKDASYLYPVSEEVLAGANPQGHLPVAGQPNLYRYHEGDFAFVGRLAGRDVGSFDSLPYQHAARVSPDGLHAAFMSQGSPTGYDNLDAKSGEADAEVYLYDATANGGEGKLICPSCNPSGRRPVGMEVSKRPVGQFTQVAAQIPPFENNLYASRVLSEDGSRLFFEANDALVLQDTNGVTDVYQWEEPGTGTCKEGDPDYSPLNEGCIELISSGQSARASEFSDASPDGSDVFFTTLSSLVGQDHDLVDLYDARVDGGFPEPPAPPARCEGEACQSAPRAPNDPTPASASFKGAGNVVEGNPKPRCAKGKRRVRRAGKVRCLKPRRHAERSARQKGRSHR